MTLHLFALAKERAGQPSIEIDLPESATVGDLKRALAEQYPRLTPLLPSLRIAVDSEYATDEILINTNAELAAIPPVSGGSRMADG